MGKRNKAEDFYPTHCVSTLSVSSLASATSSNRNFLEVVVVVSSKDLGTSMAMIELASCDTSIYGGVTANPSHLSVDDFAMPEASEGAVTIPIKPKRRQHVKTTKKTSATFAETFPPCEPTSVPKPPRRTKKLKNINQNRDSSQLSVKVAVVQVTADLSVSDKIYDALDVFENFVTIEDEKEAAQRLASIEDVDIGDAIFSFIDEATMKYVLIQVTDTKVPSIYKLVVRGNFFAEYHSDLFEAFCHQNEANFGITCDCLGGGKIQHDVKTKQTLVFGFSMSYGRADHAKTVDLLKTKFEDFDIQF